MSVSRAMLATLCVSLAILCGPLPGAGAATSNFDTGIVVSEAENLRSAETSVRNLWFGRARQAGATFMRLNVDWADAAPKSRPANPADPNIYNLAYLDREVVSAVQQGLKPVIMVYNAPNWARTGDEPGWLSEFPGAWRPSPSALAAFGRALATRYDGFHGQPRVTHYQAWVEPNLAIFLSPQWRRGKDVIGAAHYRKMLNGFYDAVNAVNPANTVVTAGTAPFGDPLGEGRRKKEGWRTRPLEFWREVLCLTKKLKKQAGTCANEAKFDILAHHPINRDESPRWKPASSDDLVPSTIGGLTKVLRAAERRGTVGTSGRHQLWAPEIWIETNPPDKQYGHRLATQARWLAETLYLIDRAGFSSAFILQIQDTQLDNNANRYTNLQSGLWFHPTVRNGDRKDLAYNAFRFPFVTERVSKRALIAWGKAPVAGTVRIQRKRGNAWSTVESVNVAQGDAFQARVGLRGKQKLRAQIGTETSNVWAQKK